MAPGSRQICSNSVVRNNFLRILIFITYLRHPYIMQLYGLVNTRGLRAMVFHDGVDHKFDVV